MNFLSLGLCLSGKAEVYDLFLRHVSLTPSLEVRSAERLVLFLSVSIYSAKGFIVVRLECFAIHLHVNETCFCLIFD